MTGWIVWALWGRRKIEKTKDIGEKRVFLRLPQGDWNHKRTDGNNRIVRLFLYETCRGAFCIRAVPRSKIKTNLKVYKNGGKCHFSAERASNN